MIALVSIETHSVVANGNKITEDDPAELQLSLFAVGKIRMKCFNQLCALLYVSDSHINIKTYHSDENWPHFFEHRLHDVCENIEIQKKKILVKSHMFQ